MVDRCDTPSYWFLISGCGKPFFACVDDPGLNQLIKEERRYWAPRGAELVRREGNHARATLDQMLTCWPNSPREIADDHSWVMVDPHEVIVAASIKEEAA